MPTSQIIHNSYPLTDDPKFPKGRFSFKREGLELPDQLDPHHLGIANLRDVTPGLSAIVTQDGYPITEHLVSVQKRAKGPDGKIINVGTPDIELRPAFRADRLEANFAGQREAYGMGLGNIKDKDQFLKQYKRSMRDTALSLLNTSAEEAKQKQALFAQGMPTTEAPKINRVATGLEALDKQIAEAKWNQLGTDVSAGQTNQGLAIASLFSDNAKKQFAGQLNNQSAAHEKVQQLEAQRAALLAQYPLLSRVNPSDFNQLNPQEQAKALQEACGGVLNDIQTTRQNIVKDKLNLWQLAPLVATTTNGLGVQPEQMQWVAEKIKSDKTWDVASKVGMGVLSIGLAVGSTFVAGPVGAAMAWGAFGTGVVGAANETEQYFTNQAAANTNINPDKSVVPPDMKGHWGWVVASWVGVGFDFAAAVQATRMMKAGMEAEQVAKLMGAKKLPARGLEAGETADKANALEEILKQSLPKEFAGQADKLLKTPQILKPEEFAQKFGSESADAVTTFTKGKDGIVKAQVFFKEGGNPLAMREEAVHISQLAEGGDIAKKATLLTEENLAKWPKMSMEQRLDIYKAKVEVEIDAQKRLLQQFGEGDPQYVKGVQHNLENLRARMAEVDLGVENPKSVEGADWLQETEAPRLFSKSGTWKWGQPNVDSIPAHPSARRSFGEMQENLTPKKIQELRDAYPSLKNENESEVRAVWHILQQKNTEKVIVGEADVKRFFGLNPNQEGIKMVDDLQITKDGKLIPIEVKNTGRIEFEGRGNAAFNKFESIVSSVGKQDLNKIDHFEIICNKVSTLGNYKVDSKTGKLSKRILGTEPPQLEEVQYAGKNVYVRYGDLGEVSK
jgi:hypothetical protein